MSTQVGTRIIIDGVGQAGMGVIRQLVQGTYLAGARPSVSLRDTATWRAHHASAGLIEEADVGLPKVQVAARLLYQAGWSVRDVESLAVDIRDCPRSSYVASVTFGLTDSHACKHESVSKAVQVARGRSLSVWATKKRLSSVMAPAELSTVACTGTTTNGPTVSRVCRYRRSAHLRSRPPRARQWPRPAAWRRVWRLST